MFLCFICDEKKKVEWAAPAEGQCPRCGGSISQLKVRTQWRFCFVPVCFRTHKDILCNRCQNRFKKKD